MNPRVEKAYKLYIEKFGEEPPAPYLNTLSNYEKDEAIQQRIRDGKPFSKDKYYHKFSVDYEA